MSHSIVRWTYFMHRSSDLESLMILSPEDRVLLNREIDNQQRIYLGEVAGKHSDVKVTLRAEQFEDVECPEGFADHAAEVFGTGTISGIDLLERIEERLEEFDDEDDEDDDEDDEDDDYEKGPNRAIKAELESKDPDVDISVQPDWRRSV